jgi:hypothetical protein
MKQHSWRYAITTASDAAITNTLEDLGYAIAERSSDYFGHRITPAGEQYLKSMLN